jgi:DNA (cytosine-5)-methyltransferase 1
MKIGSLCTGYGGLDMAVEAYFNAETIWCAEYDQYASKLIKERFGYFNHGDISKINWSSVEPIDILTAGYPCQPFSVAGNRQGSNDARHLWPYIKEAISVLRPRWVVLENVRGHLSLGFKEVLQDLAQLGYDARWQIVRASDVGAPHQRARLFIVAYPNSLDRGVPPSNEPTANSIGNRCSCGNACGSEARVSGVESHGLVTDSDGNACAKSRRDTSLLLGTSSQEQDKADRNEYRFSLEMDRQDIPNTLDQGKLNPQFVEYMMGLPKGWVTDIQMLRTQHLKMLGNGVVPQQAYYALQQLLDVDTPSEQDLC